MRTVHRDKTLSRRHIRNVYSARKQNTFQKVHQKCVQCKETEHFPDGISEMCTVHRKNTFQAVHRKCVLCTDTTLFRRYIRNLYCAQKQSTFQKVHQKCVQCTEKEHFPNGNQKYVVCTETEHFPNGTSEKCTVHRNRTLSKRYIRNVYCAQKQNTFQTVHQKCVLCTET